MARFTALGLRCVAGLLLAWHALSPSAEASETMAPAELLPGLVHFALATEDLVPVLANSNELEGESGAFLRARLLLESGHSDQGLALLEQVAGGQHHRAEAAVLLGRVYVERGQLEAAKAWFDRARKVGYGQAREQAAYGLAELARRQGQPDRAGKILAGMNAGYWAATGYLNLAADYAAEDLNTTRALVAVRVALALAETDPDDDRRASLMDELRVRAGFLAFQNDEPDKAIGFLEQVRLDGYDTPQALYLHGLALTSKGNHRAAMQSWHRAKKYPLAFAGVAEAWMAMGRGYDLSGYLGQAGEAYLAANSAYESERVTLRKLAEGIRSRGAFKVLVADAGASDVEWFLSDSRTLTQPRLAYLLDFLQQKSSQIRVHRVAELTAMSEALARQEADLAVFIQSLEQQLTTLEEDVGAPVRALKSEQEALEQRLNRIRAKTPGRSQELASLAEVLGAAADSLRGFSDRAQGRPEQIQRLLAQARRLQATSSEYAQKAGALRQRAETELDGLALAYVEFQDQKMVAAQDKTEQQIAHLYEYLALENLEGQGP